MLAASVYRLSWNNALWTCLSIIVGFTARRSAAEEEDWGTLVAVTAVRGSTAKLPCNINSPNIEDPVELVLWYKNASVTPVYSYDSRRVAASKPGVGRQQWGDEEVWGTNQRAWFDISSSPAHLLVRNVQGQDEGNYRCKVHFKASPSWSQRITLNIKDPPGFPRIQDEQGRRLEGPIGPYEDGITIRMICLSSGEPPPSLVWGGGGVDMGSGSDVVMDGNIARTFLNVVASRRTAGKIISCSTTNSSFSSGIMNTVTISLKVNLPPLKVALEAPEDWVSGGQQTSFRCRVFGASPEPIIQWWLAGRQLTAHAPLTTVAGNVSVSTVKLTPEPGDHGVPLVCKSFSPNLPGTVMHDQITLNVHFVPVATISISGGAANGVREGGSVVFTCHLKANPKVYNVTWFHNGIPLKRREWGALISNTTLRLPNVTAKMRGLYTCVGSNREGDGQSNAVNLNVEFAPICAPNQSRDYVMNNGGNVTVSCSVQAFPSSVSFTWAIRRKQDDQLTRLQTVGRDEGLTGHYTLSKIQEESVEIYCFAKNSIGNQISPCKFTIYTQGRPGPVSSCTVGNHTASGFVVQCISGPLRSMNTQYTLLVYAQKHISNTSPEGANDPGLENRIKNTGKKKETGSSPTSALGYMVRNVTTSSPYFVVGGLQPGQEFALVVRVSNEEGVSPPKVLSAFTLKDNAQTVIGMPGGGGSGGRVGSGTNLAEGAGNTGISPWGNSNTYNGGGGTNDGDSEGIAPSGINNDETSIENSFHSLIPPMIILLVASVGSILVIAILIIILLKRRGRSRNREGEIEQVKLNEEMAFVQQTRTPDNTSRETTGSSRKLIEGSEGDQSSTSGGIGGGAGGGSGGGGGNSITGDIIGIGGGGTGVGSTMIRGSSVSIGGGIGGGVGSGGMVLMSEGSVVSTPAVMLASVDGGTFGSCNGDLMTTTSRDSLLGARSKQGEFIENFCIEDTTLPILGIQKLGENTAGSVMLEGLRPMGSPLSTTCSTFRSNTLPLAGMGTLGRSGMAGLSTMTGTGMMMEQPPPSCMTSHLIHVALTQDHSNKDRTRSPTPSPRNNEGVSAL